jgi:alpha-galactosidase
MTRRTFDQALGGAAAWPQLTRTTAGSKAIAEFDSKGIFTLGNARFRQRLRLAPSGKLELEFLGLTEGPNWASPASRWGCGCHVRTHPSPGNPDLVFGLAEPARVKFVHHEIEGDPARAVELKLTSAEPARKLGYTLHLRAFADADVIEQRLEAHNHGSVPLAGLDRFDPLLVPLAIAAREACTLHYVQGERYVFGRGGEHIQPYGPYHVCPLGLPAGNSFTLSSRQDTVLRRRPSSTAEYINWFSVELGSGGDGLFGGIEWSSLWFVHFARTSSELILQGGVDQCRHDLAPGRAIASPRAFYGCYRGNVDAGIHQTHLYLRAHVMPPDPDENFPWACYNTWYNRNIELDERTLREEARLAAELGLECFYLDAGWYAGSPVKRASFGIGLGTWTENREKFPLGVAAFADFIHSLGMKFGLWVEPERVDLSLVDKARSAIRKSWLAASEAPEAAGRGGTSLLCFGNPEVVAWAKEKLAQVIAEYKVEWLKWDHNMHFVCTQGDHGHQAGDGNYAHIRGVYEVMDHLRRRFPRLAIENCASGGYRTDLGIIRYTNTAWNSDPTSPGHRVRYQTTGAGYVFPPQYLNSWFIKSREEPASETSSAALLDYYFRSRMLGAFGIFDRIADWPANLREAARCAVAAVKRTRSALRGDVHHLLPQASLFIPPLPAPTEWEAIEYFHPEAHFGVVLCFRAEAEAASRTLALRGLDPRFRYRVTWNDAGRSETRSGADWSKSGAKIDLPGKFTSEILWIEKA